MYKLQVFFLDNSFFLQYPYETKFTNYCSNFYILDMYADAVLCAVLQAESMDTPSYVPTTSASMKVDKMHFKVRNYVKTRMNGGGANLEPKESIEGMLKQIDDLDIESSGTFVRYNGENINW